jgi:hypothetical protein
MPHENEIKNEKIFHYIFDIGYNRIGVCREYQGHQTQSFIRQPGGRYKDGRYEHDMHFLSYHPFGAVFCPDVEP